MKKILSILIPMMLTSLIMCSGNMPNEIDYRSEKLSLTDDYEILYNGKPYSGKITYEELGYMNLKNGHLEGKTVVNTSKENDSFNVVDGKLEGDHISKYEDGIYVITFKNGEIQESKIKMDSYSEDLTFDSKGMANGYALYKDYKVVFKDGVGKNESGDMLKINLNNEKNGIVEKIFDENNKLLSEYPIEVYSAKQLEIELFQLVNLD